MEYITAISSISSAVIIGGFFTMRLMDAITDEKRLKGSIIKDQCSEAFRMAEELAQISIGQGRERAALHFKQQQEAMALAGNPIPFWVSLQIVRKANELVG